MEVTSKHASPFKFVELVSPVPSETSVEQLTASKVIPDVSPEIISTIIESPTIGLLSSSRTVAVRMALSTPFGITTLFEAVNEELGRNSSSP